MLKIKNVSVKFAGENSVLAVDDVSLSLNVGDRVAIVGETGSGKSVLLLAMLKLLPKNALISGSVLLDGEELLSADKKRFQEVRGGIISYVPQGGGASMNPLLTVGYQVGEPLRVHRGSTKKAAIAASVPLLRRFNLSNEEQLAKAYPHAFSGGMRQRAMVAMGISAKAKILLADEPTKGLDERRIAMVADTLNMLREETLLCVTHDMSFAGNVSKRICVMYAAQQVELADSHEIMTNPLHPYTRDMIDAMPENGMKYEARGFAPSHTSYADSPSSCRYADRCREKTGKCENMPPVFNINGHEVRCWKYDT